MRMPLLFSCMAFLLPQHRRLQRPYAPFPESGRGTRLAGSRFGVVKAVVLGCGHVEHGLSHCLGHAVCKKIGFVGRAADLPETHGLAQVGILRSPEIGEKNTPRVWIAPT